MGQGEDKIDKRVLVLRTLRQSPSAREAAGQSPWARERSAKVTSKCVSRRRWVRLSTLVGVPGSKGLGDPVKFESVETLS